MTQVDVVVIGSGPAGHKAALAATQAGRRVLMVDKDSRPGGACLHRGTIPSKTLREAAKEAVRLRRQLAKMGHDVPDQIPMEMLTQRLRGVIDAHVGLLREQLADADIPCAHGFAKFLDPNTVQVCRPTGAADVVRTDFTIVATGSRPRQPPGMDIDHELVVDSDSILSLEYLPQSLVVLGGGVIACEYASIFASLGVRVTMLDAGPRPLAFLDEELSRGFRTAFEALGGRYVGDTKVDRVDSDGLSEVTVTTSKGNLIFAEKVMVALGRSPCIEGMNLEAVGVETDKRGRIGVDDYGATACPSIYAVGDVAGGPGLASTAMEQGRRAVRHALGLNSSTGWSAIPIGIFTIPEVAAVGSTQQQAEADAEVVVGRAEFGELARGQIAGEPDGILKMIVDASSQEVLGVGIVGEGAAELVGIGQMGLLMNARIDDFVENIFNFPTMAEAYRVAALDAQRQLTASRRAA